ncbi:hypothetical protein [Streptomyces paludis]|uniref:Uncharacterized protein n=1 Tax=Streptomyces paludis TaxID=2282738 RepID=A0A345HZW2_9ACTN|nr:hypothetical protein [Streptomyces paludis]AXG82236.1 hypothetical protein DVK44_36195 [Streptomyces paludis]
MPDDLAQLLAYTAGIKGQVPVPEPVPDPTVTVVVPRMVTEQLRGNPDTAVRTAARSEPTIHRGQGYTMRVTAPLNMHLAIVRTPA